MDQLIERLCARHDDQIERLTALDLALDRSPDTVLDCELMAGRSLELRAELRQHRRKTIARNDFQVSGARSDALAQRYKESKRSYRCRIDFRHRSSSWARPNAGRDAIIGPRNPPE